ncbi:M20 family metallopeptidase [Paucibacter sp. O1-1]|nr:M20 family metallopeptidase [Paucibacter sp. O1-1]MDA3825049.1 M20 family metallopeptidase [Paucibacter sp. O1-1]
MSMTDTAEMVARISDWVRCESPSHSRSDLLSMAMLLKDEARRLQLNVSSIDLGAWTGPAVLITTRSDQQEQPGILVLAHYDTVHPIGTLTLNPCREHDGRLYGPGVYDMKAGIYLALKAISEMPCGKGLPIDLLIVPDEETGSHHSRCVIERLAKRAQLALVCEPARPNGGRCVTARKGTGLIELRVHGRPSHAGMAHEKGRSAIRELAHQILVLEGLTNRDTGLTVSVGVVEGGTMTNVVPEHAQALADVRIPDAQAAQELRRRLAAIQSVDPDVEVSVELRLNRPPMPRNSAQVELFEKACKVASMVGFTLEEASLTGGASDANFTAALGVPTLDGIGADGDGAHTMSEYICIDTLQPRLALWKQLLSQLS